ncbi:hypothetical protein OUZ56_003639 [Daphnia magna]|uniref:Uncharacterized protein n=1 Tax=Daphnia magna TaxID=35525 RepID=A0ABR0A9P6_9CRUS|nr:hypothetical protein OUZ56_003639 [Daphnia magna]
MAMELREKLESMEKRKQSDDLIIQLASMTNYLMEWFYIIGPIPRKHFSYPRLNAENFDCGAARQD